MADWRITNQMGYLKNACLRKLPYALRNTKADHDHCEFCMDKFSDSDGDLHLGYCTLDGYYWICEECCRDFKEMFGWTFKE